MRLRPAIVVVLMIAPTAWILVNFHTSAELTRIRNSLLAQVGTRQDTEWAPEHVPSGFLSERLSPPPRIGEITAEVLGETLRVSGDSWKKALTIATHLASGAQRGGDPILSNTLDAYDRILNKNQGYCADYTQVMVALSLAAGVPIREWGMSFDGFSGNGHAFVEVFDTQARTWVFLDPFYSFYVIDAGSGERLSALDFSEKLRDGEASDLRLQHVVPTHFQFRTEQQAIDFYTRGADEFFLWYGNNLFSYEATPLVRASSAISRKLEQSVAILIGVQPHLLIVATDTNGPAIDRMRGRTSGFLFATGLLILLATIFVIDAFAQRRTRRRASRVTEP